ncbi:hypothetical protein [Aquabacterium humicola]|uniref:hypothetical protein n=1 Tax=Aquabacterium humicola TaxID=3237377 RepID=UPI002542D6EC|nr:hypothetical protein [Rubrivivax pictus]
MTDTERVAALPPDDSGLRLVQPHLHDRAPIVAHLLRPQRLPGGRHGAQAPGSSAAMPTT